ncbi:MAG: energy transducer TonB [Bacteroidia bacterium]|nr:energy transducer TonB [Bacteroidia bacterium]
MGRQSRNIPTFDDLVFESRNKEYGAYQLRKKYNRVVVTGILFSTFVGCAAVIIPSLSRNNHDYIIAGGGRYVQVEMENLPAPDELIYMPPPPPPLENTSAHEVVKYVAPVIVDSIVPIDQNPVSTDEFLSQASNPDQEVNGNGIGEEVFMGEGSSGEGDVLFLVEVMPTFKGGGIEKFREWVNKRTNYPQAAIDGKIKGTVYLTFVVEKDGSVSNVEVLKGVHPLLDNEAVKAISESPKWSPGLQRGQPVRIRYQIPMSFVL